MRLAQQSGRVGSAVIDLELLITCEQVYRCCRDVRDTGWCWGGGVCLYFAVARKLSATYVEILPPKDEKDFFFFLVGKTNQFLCAKCLSDF